MSSSCSSTTFEKYDPGTNSFTLGSAQLPYSSYGHCAAALSNGDIIIAGSVYGNHAKKAHLFRTTDESLEPLPDCPDYRRVTSCGVVPAANGGEDFVTVGDYQE